MTLDTRIYVLDKVDIPALFRQCQQVLSQLDESGRKPDSYDWTDDILSGRYPDIYRDDGISRIQNMMGQGLPGWLMIDYRRNGPLRDVPDEEYNSPEAYAEISLDTSYGYKGPNDAGCGDLHVAFIRGIGKWLSRGDIRWRWQNEFTGDVFDEYEGLETLGADKWGLWDVPNGQDCCAEEPYGATHD